MTHPLVLQLYFTRSEFARALEGISDADGRHRFLPMNCISWNVGHLAWQEQRYFMQFARGTILLPELNEQFAYGAPASTPALSEILLAWRTITTGADAWLEYATTEQLCQEFTSSTGWTTTYGNLLQRVIYHYWYHTGEIMAIRQQLGHHDLAEYVGNIDTEAPYLPG